MWGEHCSECAYPACYASCAFYDPRPDLNCRRFVAGIEDAGDGLMRIRFRKWGKLEGQGTARLRPFAEALRREGRDAGLARGLAGAPLPFQLKRSTAWRLDQLKARAGGRDHGLDVDAFVLEGWSNDRPHPRLHRNLPAGRAGGWVTPQTAGPGRRTCGSARTMRATSCPSPPSPPPSGSTSPSWSRSSPWARRRGST